VTYLKNKIQIWSHGVMDSQFGYTVALCLFPRTLGTKNNIILL